MYWLVEDHVITWTEAQNMTILDIEHLAHYHEAALAAKWRNEEKATRR